MTNQNSMSEETKQILKSRIDGLQSKVKRLEQQNKDLREELESTKQRLNLLENNNKQQNNYTNKTNQKNNQKNKCVLEQLCQIPQEKRKQHIDNIKLHRATLIWENYKKWSEKTPKGKILNSNEIKKLLETLSKDTIQWQQVYRSMEQFNKTSPEQYIYIKEDDMKRAILRKKSKDLKIKINNTVY